MHNTLGHARRSRAIHDQKRIPKLYPFANNPLITPGFLQKLSQPHCHLHPPQIRRLLEPRLHNHSLELLNIPQPSHDLLDLRPQIHRLTVIHRPVIHKHEFWPNLHQPIQHPLNPHIRATTTPQPAQRRRRKEANQRIERVTSNERNSIAFSDAGGAESVGEEADAGAEGAVG
jgi:hypothetical protein